MQITPPVPMPIQTTVSPHQGIANGLHNVQVQAVQPITQNAVAPTPETHKGDKAKERKEKEKRNQGSAKAEAHGDGEGDQRGDNVNICV